MTWEAVSVGIATLSMIISGALWYRTVVSENPVIDIPNVKSSPDRDMLELCLRVRNPGRHALNLRRLVFWSPPRTDVGVTIRDVDGTARYDVGNSRKEHTAGKRRGAILDCVVEPGEEVTVEVTLPDLDRRLIAWLYWSKLTPVVFPWCPKLIVRSPNALGQLAKTAREVI